MLNRLLNIRSLMSFVLLMMVQQTFAVEVPIYDFSLTNYSQNINDHLSPSSSDYTTPLLTQKYQAAQLKQFYNHYFASDANGLSPWSEQMVKSILPLVNNIQLDLINDFDNTKNDSLHQHYAENFKEHDAIWLNAIKANMNLPSLLSINYQEGNRAIAINNTYARALPDSAPDFFHFSIAGQGFPFDNLQESAIWVGTPLYVITVSNDQAWSLVITPEAYFAWVNSRDIAYASKKFVKEWQTAAQRGLVAITKTETSILDKNQNFQFASFIGTVFPYVSRDAKTIAINIPVKGKNNYAMMAVRKVDTFSAQKMPLLATKQNFAMLLQSLQNRPYGWGGAFFFNDCSQEMKSLFTPFGIWLPRNTSQQAQMSATVNLATYSESDRIKYLKENGHPLMTMVFIGGHIMLYLGTENDVAITYQNIWGLSPASKDKRYVIGQSAFLPMLEQYPEYPDLMSLASRPNFILINLDELDTEITPAAFAKQFKKFLPAVNL